jgi:regulator of extracellular matrix RemA (YlzA/DUF370 family)
MGKLMTIDEYIAVRFTPKSAPSKRMMLEWIAKGDLVAQKIGRKYYIDIKIGDPLLADNLINKILGDDHEETANN